MAVFVVAYDLDKPGQQYDCIQKKLKSYGTYWHFQQSVWLVSTDQSAETITNELLPCLDPNDKLFVAKLAGEAAWDGYDEEGNSWISERLTNELH